MNGNSESTVAPVKYLASAGGGTAYIASVGGGDATEHQGDYVMRDVEIADGRLHPGGFDLDREGFVLVPQSTSVTDFYDDDQVTGRWEDEVRVLVREITGAKEVEIFDHTRRAASLDIQKQRQIREPASIIHNDYTAASGAKRLRDHFSDDPARAEQLMKGRFAIVNVWRSINGTVRTAPMALCDAMSVRPQDLVPVTRKSRERTGEIQQALHNPDHRWYWFPRMTMDEALLIKTCDSADDGRARFTIHTSFDDPAAPPDAPARESIETRCFVFF